MLYCILYSVRTVYITEECFEERKKLQYSYHVCAKLFKDPNSKISHFMLRLSQGLRKCWRYTLHKISKKIFCKNTFLSLQQGGAFYKKNEKKLNLSLCLDKKQNKKTMLLILGAYNFFEF